MIYVLTVKSFPSSLLNPCFSFFGRHYLVTDLMFAGGRIGYYKLVNVFRLSVQNSMLVDSLTQMSLNSMSHDELGKNDLIMSTKKPVFLFTSAHYNKIYMNFFTICVVPIPTNLL